MHCVELRRASHIAQDGAQAPKCSKGGNVINWINLYSLDGTIGFPNTYSVDSALLGGQRHPKFEQLRPGVQLLERWITASTG